MTRQNEKNEDVVKRIEEIGYDRNVAFGRILGILEILADRLFEKNGEGNLVQYLQRFQRKPSATTMKLHHEIIKYYYKYTQRDLELLDLLGKIIASFKYEDFSNSPVTDIYLIAKAKQKVAIRKRYDQNTCSFKDEALNRN